MDRAGALIVKGKILGVLFCLLFAILFGGVGLWASWTMVTTLHDALSARDWVIVRADVLASDLTQGGRRSATQRATATYRYTFEGREYTGTRLNITAMGGSDNIGDWQEEMADFLQAARDEKRQINVFVNPARPSEAVVDRAIRGKLMLFLTPFALIFGAVGAGALAGAWYMATAPEKGSPRALARAEARRRKERDAKPVPWVLWGFALVWCAMSFPMAGLLLPDIIRDRQWAGLFVLVFPLAGLLILWLAVYATWKAPRGGAQGAGTASARAAATGRPASFYDPESAPKPFAPEVAIPPEVATIEEQGSKVTIRYPGGILASLFGRVTVVANQEQLQVERSGLFGRKEVRAAPSDITEIRPVLLYSVRTGARMTNYYALKAKMREGNHITLSSGLPGAEVANAMALRIARALKVAPERVSPPKT